MKKIILVMSLFMTSAVCWSQQVQVTFITPRIVHVVKGQPTKTLVITANP